MTLDDIKKAVDLGKTVHWVNEAYQVIKSENGEYQVYRADNGNLTGLTFDGELQGVEEDFMLSTAPKSLYHRMKDAGLVVGTHVSDLYVLARPEAFEILREPEFELNRKNATSFTSQTGEGACLDIPFAYSEEYREKSIVSKVNP